MNTKGVKILALALATMMMMSACGSSDTTVDVTDDGVLTVGIINGGDVYTSKSGDTYVGVEPTLVENYVSAVEIQAEYVECTDKADALVKLDAGEVDMVIGRIGYDSTYSGKYLFSSSYGTSGLYLVTDQNVFINSLGVYEGLQVGVSVEVPIQLVDDVPGMRKVTQLTINDMNTVSSLLKTSVIVAAVCTEREALKALEGGTVQVQEIVDSNRESYMAMFNADQTSVRSDFNVIVSRYLDALATATVETAQETGEE